MSGKIPSIQRIRISFLFLTYHDDERIYIRLNQRVSFYSLLKRKRRRNNIYGNILVQHTKNSKVDGEEELRGLSALPGRREQPERTSDRLPRHTGTDPSQLPDARCVFCVIPDDGSRHHTHFLNNNNKTTSLHNNLLTRPH